MSRYALTSVVVLTMLVFGCAKKPETTLTAAPPPTGAPSSIKATAAKPVAHQETPPAGRSTAAATTATARPAPHEFAAVPDLADIHFDFDQYAIRPQDAGILDRNAAWLKANPNDLLLIEGHCDERGTLEYNIALGDRRARATMNYLVSRGVAAHRITLISYGEQRPVCTEHGEACWAKNRRAHFLVKRG